MHVKSSYVHNHMYFFSFFDLLPTEGMLCLLIVRSHEDSGASSSLGGGSGVVRRLPVAVGEPHRVGGHRAAVLVAVPRVVRVRPVLDVQDGVPEARLPEGRVPRLRLRHAANCLEHELFGQDSGSERMQTNRPVFSELRSWKWGQCLLLGGESLLVPSVANSDVDWSRLIRNWSAQAIHNVVCHI